MDELDDNNFIIYPNPVLNDLVISTDETHEAVLITDITGKMIFQSNIQAKTTKVDLSSIQSGVYIVKMKMNGRTSTKRFIKS